MSHNPIRVIGFDPGLRQTGWGVIDANGNALNFVACGTIASTQNKSTAERLAEIEAGLVEAVTIWQPHEAAVETSFVSRDAQATLKLGQARALCLLVPAREKMPVQEYAPNLIKRAITGNGHADKNQIGAMIKILLPKANPDNNHAADALAVAITHAHHRSTQTRITQQAIA